jgi:hypothetical protein
MSLPPFQHQMPVEDFHALCELGYASGDKAMREAAGRLDTWQCKVAIYLQMVRDHIERDSERR